jgi:hypothetical protein
MLSAVMVFAVPRSAKKSESSEAPAGKVFFGVYSDQSAKGNHYIPSGWMGDYGDMKLNTGWTENPHSGKTCIKVIYNAKMAQNAGWCGIYWQYPPNNWGARKGFNVVGAKKLTFWARGGKGGEKISEFKVGGITGDMPDTDSQSIGPVELTKEWKQYTIDLTDRDLSNISGGFCFSASKDDNSDGFELYLDDIQYE